ncbi:hypothetical protein BC332_00576 [Capsicum chinense]|uniref:3'-5' exonuclease domain-containing protein n=1 Tax=Capsicum annuum TaxID=4072 RepID=A0A2G3AES5_CAPAN|nr:hypothetical protein T459_00621 [Capsicum annuum]PHU28483.1 hypothetical protein BC332_00576 [Capsicum chinense]
MATLLSSHQDITYPTHTFFSTVPFYDFKIEATVTKKASEVDKWIFQTIQIHRRRLHKLLIGLDIEWRAPHYPTVQLPSTALLQLCVGRVHGDALKLNKDYGLYVANTVDLNKLALVVKEVEEYGRIGLKRMAYEVLGKVMKKPFDVTMSEWDADELCVEQVEYAAIDAFVSFELGISLFSELFSRGGGV